MAPFCNSALSALPSPTSFNPPISTISPSVTPTFHSAARFPGTESRNNVNTFRPRSPCASLSHILFQEGPPRNTPEISVNILWSTDAYHSVNTYIFPCHKKQRRFDSFIHEYKNKKCLRVSEIHQFWSILENVHKAFWKPKWKTFAKLVLQVPRETHLMSACNADDPQQHFLYIATVQCHKQGCSSRGNSQNLHKR